MELGLMVPTVLVGLMLVVSDAASPPASPIQTALLSIGFVQAKLSDFRETPEYQKRLATPSGFLAVSADFRGDGVPDQAGILQNLQRGVAYVVVSSIREKADTYVVKQFPISETADVGLRVAVPLSGQPRGLVIFSLTTSKSETFDLVDDNFVLRTAR